MSGSGGFDMPTIAVILTAVFLPLFPLSMLFNLLYTRVKHPLPRSVMLLAWPLIGLAVLKAFATSIPAWLPIWAVLTSILYALRALALREVGLWTGFLATSSWALLWVLGAEGSGLMQLCLFAIGISVPLALMATLTGGLERRYGAAYLGLYGGLAQTIPRFSGVLVMVVLAVIATPLFPAFFAMLSIIIKAIPVAPSVAIGVGIVWMLWSWAGAKLLQGLIVGQKQAAVVDLSMANMWLYVALLAALVVGGVYGSGVTL
jgi:NADH:ubiquinone oxidoreductase subunit 4 (subunit M)